MLKNDLLLRAARGEDVERPPVWLMRQAGRILPQYRALRNKAKNFKELVTTPELAAEVTIQPVNELKVDAAIIFSDILVIPEAMGLRYEIEEGTGPVFPRTIQSKQDIQALNTNPMDTLAYVTDAISLTKRQLDGRVPLIGFAGAPWTLFAYMLEGTGSKTFSKARQFLYKEPEAAHLLLDKITKSTIDYLRAQIEAGADLVQLFDSWAGILPHDQYMEYSYRYISAICDAIDEVPITVFAKGAHSALKDFKKLNCEVIGLDWNMDIKEARALLPDKTLQGNLDPCALYASEKILEKATKQMLLYFGKDRYIVNLGHGVYPDTPLDHVKLFIETVKYHNW